MIMKNIPDRLYINKKDKDLYSQLLGKNGPFDGKDNKHIFMLSLAYGFKYGKKTDIADKEGMVRTEYLDKNEKSMMKAIGIAENNNLNALIDKKSLFNIAENYANTGLHILYDEAFNNGINFNLYFKKLESELTQVLKESEEIIKELKNENSAS